MVEEKSLKAESESNMESRRLLCGSMAPHLFSKRRKSSQVSRKTTKLSLGLKLITQFAFFILINFVDVNAEPLYKGVTCFCSLQKCQVTNNLCTSYFGCYQMNIVLPPQPINNNNNNMQVSDATPSTFTVIAACIESRSQNNTHCGPDQLYRQSSPNTEIKCCSTNLCNDIDSLSDNHHQLMQSQSSSNLQSRGGASLDFRSNYPPNSIGQSGDNSNRNQEEEPLWSTDFWFRIAVVTVPITGAVILVFLIIVAIKLLRQEDMRHKLLAQQKMQTLSALHRGCTEHYCHLTGSVTSHSDHDVSKCDKYSASKNTVCQYSPVRQIPAPLTPPFSNNPSHLMPNIMPTGNLSPYAKCDTIQTKPVVTRPPDICECHSPGMGPTQILANRSANRNVYNNSHFYTIQSPAMFASEHV